MAKLPSMKPTKLSVSTVGDSTRFRSTITTFDSKETSLQ